jgi:hypothetical protein
MRKWIGIMTAAVSVLSSTLVADEAPDAATIQVVPAEEAAAPSAIGDMQEQAPKQVGKASADSMNTAKSSNAAKYVLAASAVVIGVAAIILVSRHHGHHRHGGGESASHSH